MTFFLLQDEAISFSTSTISTKIPDHLPVGSFVMLLEPDGADYAEIVNYTVIPHSSYPTATDYFSVGVNSGIKSWQPFSLFGIGDMYTAFEHVLFTLFQAK